MATADSADRGGEKTSNVFSPREDRVEVVVLERSLDLPAPFLANL